MKQAKEQPQAQTLPRIRPPKRELLVAGILLLVGLVACFLVYALSPRGAWVEVTVNGERVAVYSLAVDGEHAIGETNTLVIEDGCARLVRSHCPDHRCERGRIDREGATLTCLPNRVQVRVLGADETAPDLVTQ